MKFKVKQTELAKAVKAINRCLPRRPHLPVLGGINIVAKDGIVSLTTTDMSVGLRVNVEAQVEQEGQAVIVGKNFVETVNFLESAETEVTTGEKEVLVSSGRDRAKLPLLTDEFPGFDDSFDASSVVKKDIDFWSKIVSDIAFTASNDQSRPALTGILLKAAGEKTQIVCTDGFRLAIWDTKEKINNDESLEVIASAKALTDLVAVAGVLGETKVGFYHNAAAEQLVFIGEQFVFFSKLINANYPPFEKIVPLEFAVEAQVERSEMLKNLTKASVFTKVDSNTVKLHLGAEQLDYNAASLGDGSFQSSQELVKKQGDELEISFNIKYLQDFLNTGEGETVWLGCNTPTTPAMLRDPGAPERKYVVMPFKPKN